jgi:hypothetical protein
MFQFGGHYICEDSAFFSSLDVSMQDVWLWCNNASRGGPPVLNPAPSSSAVVRLKQLSADYLNREREYHFDGEPVIS